MFPQESCWIGCGWRLQLLSAILLLLTGASKAVAAPTRMAVVASGPGTEVAHLLMAAEVCLADDADIQLLDRENVAEVLAEQKLTVSGWVDPAEAVRVGKLLDVQLFAVLRDNAADAGNPDLIVFSAQTGARIWDTPVSGKSFDQQAESLAAALRAARAKYPGVSKGTETVSLLTVRNADLPRSSDPLVEAAGRWLERELLRSPNLTVLERTQARRLSEERKLPTAAPLPDLWPSLRLIELEIGRGEGEKLRGAARVTGSEGAVLFTVHVSVPGRDPLAIAEALARELEVKLEAEPGKEGPGREEESLRFYRESQFFRNHNEYDRALVAAEAAHALAPDDDRGLRWLAWVAGMAATEKIDPGRSTSGGRPRRVVSAEELAASLPIGWRGLETLTELFIRQTRSQAWPKLSQDIPHPFLRIYLGKIASLPDLSEQQQQEVDALLADYRTFLVDTVWPACRRAGDGPLAYRNATSTLSGWIVPDQFGTLSKRRADWASDLGGMMRDWGTITESRLAHEDPLELRVADYLLGNLRHKQQHAALTPGVYKALAGAYEELSDKETPLLRLRGTWLKLSLDQLAAEQPDTRGLAPDPPEISARVAALLREAKALIVDSGTPPLLRNTWIELVRGSFEQLPAERRLDESQQFCEFLLEHKIYHERTIELCLLRLSHGEQGEQQAAVALSEKTIRLLEKPSEDMTDQQRAQAIHGLQERKTAVLTKLGPLPTRNAPWESARTIVDLEKHSAEFRAIMRPAIAGKRVAALGLKLPGEYDLDQPGRVELALLQFPLDGGSQIQGGALVVSDLPIRDLAEQSTQSPGAFGKFTLQVDHPKSMRCSTAEVRQPSTLEGRRSLLTLRPRGVYNWVIWKIRSASWRSRVLSYHIGIAIIGLIPLLAATTVAAEPVGDHRPILPLVPHCYADLDLPAHLEKELREADNTSDNNRLTDAGATLGRVLFYDTHLSRNDTIACASCHVQEKGFADPRRFSLGFAGGATKRNAMGLANLRYTNLNGSRPGFFWDERAETLEAQVLMPIQDQVEMGSELPELERKLRALPYYPPLFEAAFGSPEVTSERVAKAVAQFMRAMTAFDSRFDRAAAAMGTRDYSQDFADFTPAENLGKSLFIDGVDGVGEIGCAHCHQPPTFGMPTSFNNGLDRHYKDQGLGARNVPSNDPFTPNNNGKFKAPSLRNIALTAPYMHDGRFETLQQVVDHYSEGVHPHENVGLAFPEGQSIDGGTSGFQLNERQKSALIAFLHTLTDETLISDPKFSNPFNASLEPESPEKAR